MKTATTTTTAKMNILSINTLLTPVAKMSLSQDRAVTAALWGLKACWRRSLTSPLVLGQVS